MSHKSRRRTILLSLIALTLAGWLFTGVYKDREFADHYLFVKHRPSLKFRFFSPVGETDTSIEQLAPTERYEEMMFKAYVQEGGGSGRSLYLFF